MIQSEVYISVDIETAGPSPVLYSMLSLGACVVGNTDAQFYVELKPINDGRVSEAMAVHGLNFEDLKHNGENPQKAMRNFENWLLEIAGRNAPIFVGWNAAFDWKFVDYYFYLFCGRNPFRSSPFDIRAYVAGILKQTFAATTKELVIKLFSPFLQHTHHALEDAIEQAEILGGVFKEFRIRNA